MRGNAIHAEGGNAYLFNDCRHNLKNVPPVPPVLPVSYRVPVAMLYTLQENPYLSVLSFHISTVREKGGNGGNAFKLGR